MSRLERRRRRARRPRAPTTTRRPARAPHRAAHRGRPLLVADQRYPGGRDAGLRRTIQRGAALGSDQFPAGAAAIVSAYRLFAASPHAEFLIDRQGYIRAIAQSRGEAAELETLLGQIQELNQEKTPAEAPPEEHVH